MASASINSSYYYYIGLNVDGSIWNLTDGYTPSGTPASLYITNVSYSSNNWQLFSQDSVYLLRNYDFKLEYQLGVNTSRSSPVPELQAASGELSQQWNLSQQSDGTLKMTNLGLGEGYALGIEVDSSGAYNLAMNKTANGSHWVYNVNVGLDAPSSMLQSVLLQAPSSTSTPAAGATQASASGSHHSSSGGISGGAIGGIVAAVVISGIAALVLLLCLRQQRRRRRQSGSARRMGSEPLTKEKTFVDAPVEANPESLRFELGGERAISELPG